MSDPSRSRVARRPAVGGPPAIEQHPVIVCFSIQAAAEPGVMPRILELFGRRGLVPTRWHSAVVVDGGATEQKLHIDIQMAAMTPDVGDHFARCLRRLVNVECVLASVKQVQPFGNRV